MSAAPAGLLLLATWLGVALALVGLGLLLMPLLTPMPRRMGRCSHLAPAGWVGLGAVTLVALMVNLVAGLGTPVARILAWVTVVAGWVLLIRWWMLHRPRLRVSGARLVIVLMACVGLVLAALWSAGAATNYDTGLYHVQSIWYSRDSALIPGLANLHDRLGFNSSMWPLSAAFGLGLWEGSEFRLANGVILTLLVINLVVRVSRPRTQQAPGTVLLVGGVTLCLAVIAQYPERLIASSAQDTAALLLAIAGLAALLDAGLPRDRVQPMSRVGSEAAPTVTWRTSARLMSVMAIVMAVQCALMRPLGWVLVGSVILVTAILMGRRVGARSMVRALLPAWVIAAAALAIMLIRDAVLSGWLLFPLGAFPMPVPWRSPDPASAARDITGWARTPFQDVDQTLANGDWIWGWLRRLPTDWSIPTLLGLLVLLVVPICVSRWARAALRSMWRPLLAVELPVLAVLAAWFINAPDPRFAWGYLIGIALVPVAAVVAAVGLMSLWQLMWAAIYVALLILALARGSFSVMTWHLVPLPVAATRGEQLSDGTRIQVPTRGDQCWSAYPLCAPEYAPREIRLRGASVFEGLEPVRQD